MAFVVEDGTGLSDATSYATRGEALDYLSKLPGGTPQEWTDAAFAGQEAALMESAVWLDGNYKHRWKGYRVNATQSLDWGRYGVTNESGYQVTNTPLPAGLKAAAIWMALESVRATAAGETLWPNLEPGKDSSLKRIKEKFDVFERDREYMGGSNTRTTYTRVEALLADLLEPVSSGRMELS
jgi:hypothetical protein